MQGARVRLVMTHIADARPLPLIRRQKRRQLGSVILPLPGLRLGYPDIYATILGMFSMLRVPAWTPRRRHWLLAFAACLVTGGVAVAVPRLTSPEPTASRDGQPMTVSNRFHGFNVEMSVAFTTDRLLVRGQYEVDGRSTRIGFYNNNGSDETYASVRIHAGDSIFLTGSLNPECDGTDALPVAVVTSKLAGGEVVTDHFNVDAQSAQTYEAERAWWCATPAHASIMNFRQGGPTKSAFVTMDLINTTDKPVTVTSGRLRYDRTTKPWDRGLLTADEQPIRPPRM
jgi:hypothetical protein